MAQRKVRKVRRSNFRLGVELLAAGFALLTAKAFAPILGFPAVVADAGQSLSIAGLIWPTTRLLGVLCFAFGFLILSIAVLFSDTSEGDALGADPAVTLEACGSAGEREDSMMRHDSDRLTAISLGVLSCAFGIVFLLMVGVHQLTIAPDEAGLPWESPLTAVLKGWNGWVLGLLPVILGAGFIFLATRGKAGHGDADTGHDRQLPPAMPMNEAASRATCRISGLLSRLHAMPAHLIPQDAAIELERIESSHLVDLTEAHREARAVLADETADADDVDAEYARSIDHLSDALEALIHQCEAAGRDRLAVQRRFIGVRHAEVSRRTDGADGDTTEITI